MGEEKTIPVSIYVDSKMEKWIRKTADKKKWSISQVVKDIVERQMASEKGSR